MLDWVYLHESPLPDNIKQIAKFIRLPDECERITDVLREFFDLTEYGYMQKNAQEQINKYNDKSSKAKKAVTKRWAESRNEPHTDVLRTEYECNTNQEPITNKHKPIKELVISNDITCQQAAPADHCPHEKILQLYSESLPELSQPIKDKWKGSASAVQLKARWREDKRHRDLDFWKWFFGVVKSSDFHMGKVVKWKVDIHWLVSKRGFNKILELGVNNGR